MSISNSGPHHRLVAPYLFNLTEAERRKFMAVAVAEREQAQRIAPVDLEGPPETVLGWAQAHRQIDGRAFSLRRFGPLEGIYAALGAAEGPRQTCVIKPAQRGVSELAINYACFALDRGAAIWTADEEDGVKDGLNVGYIFPTDDALGEFSKERIHGLRSESTYLAELFSGRGEFDAVGFKQVRKSYLYLRGAKSENGLVSFPADLLVLDEYDQMTPSAIALVRRRLNASQVARELDLSTPTVIGSGIHERYLESDRHVYEQCCRSCDTWVVVDFHRDVHADGEPWDTWQYWNATRLRTADVALHCPACRTAWDYDQRVVPGRWVAEQPQVKNLRGYWVPALAFPMVDLTEFAVRAINPEPFAQMQFYRADLGKPYESKGGRITEAMIYQLDAALPGGRIGAWKHRNVTMGVDVGSRLHYRISGQAPDNVVDVLKTGSVTDWAALSGLMASFGVRLCVVDALPETHSVDAWQRLHPGKVLRAFYPGPQALQAEMFRVDLDKGAVQINRTRAMDHVQAVIAAAQERWPTECCRNPEVIAHLTAPSRVVGQNARGQETIDWIHTKPDHLFHACVYDQTARAVLLAQEKSTTGVLLASGARTKMVRE